MRSFNEFTALGYLIYQVMRNRDRNWQVKVQALAYLFFGFDAEKKQALSDLIETLPGALYDATDHPQKRNET